MERSKVKRLALGVFAVAAVEVFCGDGASNRRSPLSTFAGMSAWPAPEAAAMTTIAKERRGFLRPRGIRVMRGKILKLTNLRTSRGNYLAERKKAIRLFGLEQVTPAVFACGD
jgi:hypothetical protein